MKQSRSFLASLKLFFALGAVAVCATANAWVHIPCELGEKPVARMLAANRHVFVARILSVSFKDPFPDNKDIEYPPGTVQATFRVLATIKGDPTRAEVLTQKLFGNPDSRPFLQVARDYVVFTNDFEIIPPGCISRAIGIAYNSADAWKERLTSKNPDSPEYIPRTSDFNGYGMPSRSSP